LLFLNQVFRLCTTRLLLLVLDLWLSIRVFIIWLLDFFLLRIGGNISRILFFSGWNFNVIYDLLILLLLLLNFLNILLFWSSVLFSYCLSMLDWNWSLISMLLLSLLLILFLRLRLLNSVIFFIYSLLIWFWWLFLNSILIFELQSLLIRKFPLFHLNHTILFLLLKQCWLLNLISLQRFYVLL